MAYHWRAVSLQPHAQGVLEIGELQLWGGGVRLDIGATVTSVLAPDTGAVADLVDNNASTSVTWSASKWREAGMALVFAMPADVTVDEIRVATGANKSVSLESCMLQSSTDAGASWTTVPLPNSIIGSINYVTPATIVAVTSSTGVSARAIRTTSIVPVTSRAGIRVGGLSMTLWRINSVNGERLDGLGMIEGTLMVEADIEDDDVPDIPVVRLLRVHRESDGRMVKEGYSDGAGIYSFKGLHMEFKYSVIGYDNVGHSYRAVIADNITPVLMP